MSESFSLHFTVEPKDNSLIDVLSKIESSLESKDFDSICKIVDETQFSSNSMTLKKVKSILLPWSEFRDMSGSEEGKMLVSDALKETIKEECLLTLIIKGKRKLKITAEGYGSTADDFCSLFLLFITSFPVSDFTAKADSGHGWLAEWAYSEGKLKVTKRKMEEF